VNGYNPYFDKDGLDARPFVFRNDLDYGLQGEAWVQNVLVEKWEIKTDRYMNGNMVVETQQNPKRLTDSEGQQVWKNSGIRVTEASWWIYVFNLGQTFIVVSVPRLKKFLEMEGHALRKTYFALSSDNPARGYLLTPENVAHLLIDKKYDC